MATQVIFTVDDEPTEYLFIHDAEQHVHELLLGEGNTSARKEQATIDLEHPVFDRTVFIGDVRGIHVIVEHRRLAS